jgi:signal transduction histidine kinase
MNPSEGNRVELTNDGSGPIGDDSDLLNPSIIAAAHELKTPLVLLRQLSLQLAETTDESRKTEIICRMRLTSERSLRLVDNLTRAARLDDAMFEMEPIQLSSICYDVIDEMQPLSRALDQNFCIRTGRKSVVAVANRDLLRSLLVGLIDNALQYNQPGGDIVISAGSRDGRAVVSVRDNGPIMDLAEFRKLAQSIGLRAMPMSARPLSSGLGLMIAGAFANAMGGGLNLSRHHRGGVTFRADLPVSSQLSLLGL